MQGIRWVLAIVLICCLSAAYAQQQPYTPLTGQTFERLTQSATGQTSGIWFVMWTAPGGLPQCPSCEQANAQWERMTASQNQRGSPISFGQVEATDLGSAKLFQRFGLEELPSYVLFRDKKMYRYSGDGSEQDLLAFLSHEYREVHTEDVPPPPSMWSDISEKLLDFWDEWWTTDNKRKAFYAGAVMLPVLPWAIPLVVWLRQRRPSGPSGPKTRRD